MTTYRIRSSEFHGQHVTRTGLTLHQALNSPLGCGDECCCGGGTIEDETTDEAVDLYSLTDEELSC
jgi:hypothetical protein